MLFSIVIAVRNENQYIEQCLKGIFAQDFKENFEVIIIDGMSTDGTYETLLKLKNQYHFNLERNKKINAAAGRNIGIKKAQGKYIAFIDGDAIPARDWLTQIHHVFSQQKENVVGVGGPDKLPTDSTKKARRIGYVMTSPLARGGRFNPSTQHSLIEHERYADHIPTCNLCLKKQVFQTIGVFDEKFIKGQDLELNYRITKAGFKLVYSPKIQVVHYRKNHLRSFVRQIYKWAKAKIAIIKKHGLDGLTSHIYLWPVYSIILVLLTVLFSLLLQLIPILMVLILFSSISYFMLIVYESYSLSQKYNDKWLILYAAFLILIIHITYALGVFSSLIRRGTW